ncbi:MAG: hypothetical protein JNL72_08480 [Flavipsychrobacter sp.]|nr:hypothetical protein [Flavipsychrobacter sp.]
MLSRLCCLLFAIISILVVSNKRLYNRPVFESDKAGYYIYLPAIFIYDDIAKLDFYNSISQKYDLAGEGNYKLAELQNGNRITKYPIGTAIFNLPFFLITHIFCTVTDLYPADGYSIPYRIALIGSTIIWSLIGLFILRRILRNNFNDRVTAIVLLSISFGTNLYYYVAFEPGMSHPYSFFLFALILYLADQWSNSATAGNAWLLGLSLGLCTVVRPVNIIIILIPLLWKIGTYHAFKERLTLFTKRPVFFPLVIFFVMPILLQMLYWKNSTGHFVYYSYGYENFDWGYPKVWKGLFSYRKGWFVYTPIAFVAFIGIFFCQRRIVFNLLLFFVAAFYVFFSWENWYYGGSYGCRPLIETLPLLAIPLGCLTVYVSIHTTKIIRTVYFVLIALLIALNAFQSYQYAGNVIHWDRMTKKYYWRVFLKLHGNEQDRKLLLPDEEYYSEIESWQKK